MIPSRVFAAAAVLLAFAAAAPAAEKASPFYALPADGAGVEYEWTRTAADSTEERGTLRLSSVGTAAGGKDRVPCRWVEVTVEAKRGDRTKWERRKLLVAEKALADGKPLA